MTETAAGGNAPEEELDLQGLHSVLLEILTDIAALCERHGLRYWLYCGTLLGAVRENDFIPWDDDVDLAMPARDYRKFRKLARKELPEKYELDSPWDNRSHYLLFMKVVNRETTLLRKEFLRLGIPKGIYVDIYPLAGTYKRYSLLKLQFRAIELAKGLLRVRWWEVCGFPKDPENRKKARMIRAIPGPVRRLAARLLMRFILKDPYRSRLCCTLDAAPFFPKFETKDWREDAEGTLRGRTFRIPAEYDKLLHIMYGDYRTPPPPEQRANHMQYRGGVILDPDRPYRYYEEKLLKENGK